MRGRKIQTLNLVFQFNYKQLLLTASLLIYSSGTNMICKAITSLMILISVIIGTTNCIGESPTEAIKQWSLVNFDFPYDWPVNDKNLYNAEQIVTTGFEIGNNRIFLATPRLFSGIPATISSVSRDTVGDSPVLKVSDKVFFAESWIRIKILFRLFPIGLIMQRAWNNTIVVISAWYQSTDWKLIRAIACGRLMLACQDPLKTLKLRAHLKFWFMIWILIRLFGGLFEIFFLRKLEGLYVNHVKS